RGPGTARIEVETATHWRDNIERRLQNRLSLLLPELLQSSVRDFTDRLVPLRFRAYALQHLGRDTVRRSIARVEFEVIPRRAVGPMTDGEPTSVVHELDGKSVAVAFTRRERWRRDAPLHLARIVVVGLITVL